MYTICRMIKVFLYWKIHGDEFITKVNKKDSQLCLSLLYVQKRKCN